MEVNACVYTMYVGVRVHEWHLYEIIIILLFLLNPFYCKYAAYDVSVELYE